MEIRSELKALGQIILQTMGRLFFFFFTGERVKLIQQTKTANETHCSDIIV